MRIAKLMPIVAATLLVAGSPAMVVAQGPATEPAMQRSDLLPGVTLLVQEVEPGVFRVEGDGVRDLALPVEPMDPYRQDPNTDPGARYWASALREAHLVASDEGVWLGRPDGIVRLGEAGYLWSPREGSAFYPLWLEVSPDGRLHVPERMTILSADGWQKVSVPRKRGFRFPSPYGTTHMLFAPDGSFWVEGLTGKQDKVERARLARKDADGWSVVDLPLPRPGMRSWPVVEELQATGDGVLYVRRGERFLQRFDGKRWETLPRPGPFKGLYVARDGTVWSASYGPEQERLFHRLDADGGGWTTHEVTQEHPRSNLWLHPDLPGAGHDGALWFPVGDGGRERGFCDGVVRYDGTTEARFLEDLCVYDIAFGPGGATWILAGEWTGSAWDPDEVGPIAPYVITSEAVAASR